MTIETYTAQLERVQTAIAAIEDGSQSTSWNGRSMTRADLGTLYQREKQLRASAGRESRGGIRVRGGTPVG